MATKKSSKKKDNSKKVAPKRTSKRIKAKAPEAIVVEESKGIYTISTAPSDVNEQITDSVTTTTETNVTDAISTPPTTAIENDKVDNSDLVTENVSYNNMVVPQAKDNTILYIGAALGAIVLLTILFL